MSRLAGTLALLFCVLLPRAASARGPDGHRVVGSIADQMLNPNAKQQIASILGVDLAPRVRGSTALKAYTGRRMAPSPTSWIPNTNLPAPHSRTTTQG
jgi:hypothetical protein